MAANLFQHVVKSSLFTPANFVVCALLSESAAESCESLTSYFGRKDTAALWNLFCSIWRWLSLSLLVRLPTEEILSLKAILHSIREQKSNFTALFVVAVAPGKKQCFALYMIHCTGQTMHQLFIKWQTTFCVSPSMRIGVTIHCIRQPSQPSSCKLLLTYQYYHQPHPFK